jgi:hypothetical protein
MKRILGLALVLISARVAHADSSAKAVEKAVRAQVAHLFDASAKDGSFGDGKYTTALADTGVVDGDGLRKALGEWVYQYPFVHDAKIGNLKITVDAGDKGAWASFTVHVDMVEDEQGDAPATFDLRATEVLDATDDGWKVIAGAWSKPVLDKAAKAMAAGGKLGTLTDLASTDSDNLALAPVIAALRDGTVAAMVSPSSDVAVYGTDAKTPRLGGKKTAKAWGPWWKQVSVEGKVAADRGDGGVYWMAANLAIHKGKVDIPARVFLVLAEDDKGVPRVVAAQLAVPQPAAH